MPENHFHRKVAESAKNLHKEAESRAAIAKGKLETPPKAARSIGEVKGIFRRYATGKTRAWETIRSETERRVAQEIADD